MKIQCKDNIGSTDAAHLGLNHKDLLKGAVVEVSESVGQAMLQRNFGVVPEPEPVPESAPAKPVSASADPKPGNSKKTPD